MTAPKITDVSDRAILDETLIQVDGGGLAKCLISVRQAGDTLIITLYESERVMFVAGGQMMEFDSIGQRISRHS